MIIRLSEYEMFDRRTNHGQGIGVGETYAVAEEENLLTGEKRYIFKEPDTGFAGNLDHTERYYHGWRGTTDNWHRMALGVFEVLSITEQKNGKYCIKLSKDLHPEWE